MEINNKIIFKVIYSISPVYKHEDKYLSFREILKKNRQPENDVEKLFHDMCRLFHQLVESTKVDLNFFVIDSIKFKKHNLQTIIKSEDPLKIFRYIIKQRVFYNYSKEIASIVYNALLLKKEKLPVILGNQMLEQLEKFIDQDITDSSLSHLISYCEKKSLFFNQKYQDISVGEIIKIIKKHQQKIVSDFFVNKMWLFGSFARGTATSYSDIDIMIEKEEEYDFTGLKQYLSDICKRVVDIKNYQQTKPFFSNDAITERILIF